jgi:RND family efflux transporter MFP subunit
VSRRRELIGLAAAAALAGIVTVLGAAWLPIPGDAGGGVPTFTVERGVFERRVTADGHLEAVRATPLTLDTSVRGALRIAWLAADGSRVEAGDPVVRFDASEMEKRLRDAEDELSTTALKIDKERTETTAELENLDRDTELADLELTTARQFQKLDEMVYSRHEILESEIDETLAAEKKKHAEETRESREHLGQAEMEMLAIERRRARQKIDEAREHLDALEITAPHDGLVVFRRDWRGNMPRVGDTVYRGNTLAEIPDLSEMQAEVYVLEADAGGLAVGQTATVVLDAQPGTAYPALVERVEALAKPRVRGSPVQYFAVTLRIEHTDPERMKPGQRVSSELLLERREGALVIPRQTVFERDGRKIVFRLRGGSFEPVPVKLGAVGLGRVVVDEGLAAGDVIALVDPGRPVGGAPEPEGGRAPTVEAVGEPRL